MTLVYDIYIHSYLWQFCEHDSDVLNKPCMIRAEVEHSLDVNDLEAAELTNVYVEADHGYSVSGDKDYTNHMVPYTIQFDNYNILPEGGSVRVYFTATGGGSD